MPGLVSLHYILSVVLRKLMSYSLFIEWKPTAEVTKNVPSLGLRILEGTHTRFLGFPGKWVYKSIISDNSTVQPAAITAVI